MVDPIFPIEGAIRPYEWGSRSAIQQLLGLEPDGRPAAELWFGAHAGDPSPALGTTLDRLISAHAEALLGAAVVAHWGERLPFLLKVLAADKALSMQVHPNREQARAGYDAEEAAQPSVRNYADPNPKPELLCALTPFEALCGFRPVAETLAVLDDLAVTELAFLADTLRQPDGLRSAFTILLRHDDPATLAAAVAARATADGPLRATWIAAHDFPGDIGVVLTLLLNYVRLDPGEAIYLAAGNVHSYLRGMGVEIMANSDNVLRCGLTPKHIDVSELLKITDFTELAEPRWPAHDGVFRVPVPEFALRPVHGVAEVGGEGPRIVLCTQGTASVGELAIGPGHAAFLAAGEAVAVRTDGMAFVASIG
ncbi:MAG TPA: mannose-6-phosphate isomerase, class I [Jatrophihabitantaceae bacterium]|jgi:mannose-6-phosphate isomerase|nr:mannose-6-phosphate isomerase, class I [Jatrophihabitantaceae bacterium]